MRAAIPVGTKAIASPNDTMLTRRTVDLPMASSNSLPAEEIQETPAIPEVKIQSVDDDNTADTTGEDDHEEDEEGFGDDFDDFEEGGDDADFDDFDDGFQQAETHVPAPVAPQVLPPTSLPYVSPLVPRHFVRI